MDWTPGFSAVPPGLAVLAAWTRHRRAGLLSVVPPGQNSPRFCLEHPQSHNQIIAGMWAVVRWVPMDWRGRRAALTGRRGAASLPPMNSLPLTVETSRRGRRLEYAGARVLPGRVRARRTPPLGLRSAGSLALPAGEGLAREPPKGGTPNWRAGKGGVQKNKKGVGKGRPVWH